MTLSHDMADYPHQMTENIRFSETDLMGHVNNTVFGIYFEIGRSGHMDELGFHRQKDVASVIVKTEMQYLGMIYWPGTIEIGTRVNGAGNSSFTMDQILVQKDRVVGSCSSVMVMIDPETNKSTPIPDDIRASLKL